MKTVSGRVISSKPIPLSKAASVLLTFVSADRGASQAVSAYLSRSSAAFNELVQFHKELKARRSERKHKKSLSEDFFDNGNVTDTNRRGDGSAIGGAQVLDLEEEERNHGGDFDGEGRNSGRKKKKRKKSESEDGGYVRIDEEQSIERKKRKKREIEDEELDDSEERQSMKKKRKRKHE